MNNIILFAMSDNQIKNMKKLDSVSFFEQLENKNGQNSNSEFVIHIPDAEEVKTKLVLNSDGFLKLPDSDYDLFESFSNFDSYDKLLQGMIGDNEINEPVKKQNLHLFALSEKDISEYKSDIELFKTMSKYVKETKRENKVGKKCFVSKRVMKVKNSPNSPLCYVAGLPERYNLLIQVKDQLITFFSQDTK